MLLDIKTFLVMGAAFVALTGTSVLCMVPHMTPNVRASARAWAAANACLALSWTLAAFGDVLPTLWTVLLGNLCYLLAATLIYQSVRLFDAAPPRWQLHATFVLPVILVVVGCRYLIDAYDLRVIIMSAAVALMLACASLQVFRGQPAAASRGRHLSGIWLAANASFFAFRVGLTLSQGAALPVLENGLLQSLSLGVGLISMVGLMLSYFLLYASRVTAELAQQAYQDSLTGLDNRRAFELKATPLLKQAQSKQQPVTLLLLDVDRFKAINDGWGHAVGDEALSAVGRALRSAVRPQDIVARLGGDEFALLVAGLDITQLQHLVRRLHEAVATQPLTLEITLNISVGVAPLSAQDTTLTDLLKRADEALYAHKRRLQNETVGCYAFS